MTPLDRVVEIAATIVLIFGGYQFYFWAQRQRFVEAFVLDTRWDDRIAYDPRWVWCYCALYYPLIVLTAMVLPSWEEFGRAVGCFLLLLAVQVVIFVLVPTAVKAEFRAEARSQWIAERGLTFEQRWIDLVWSYDKLRNGTPSMHVSMATMVDLTIWKWWPQAGVACMLFPLLIAISAVKTKQHYLVDVVPGAMLAGAVFFAWSLLWAPAHDARCDGPARYEAMREGSPYAFGHNCSERGDLR